MASKKANALPLLESELIDTLGLNRLLKPTPVLEEWLSATGTLSAFDMELLEKSQQKFLEVGNFWNEEELKMEFISQILFLAYFSSPIRTFYDREISETIGEHLLLSKVDMMLSKGVGEIIKTPYFFLHEYKREKKYSGDPIGQMLGGMLIGQAKNKNGKPIYGCYVQGRFWFFSVLEEKGYVVSKAFDSSDLEESKQIVFILRKLKTIILERLMV